jgi:hypothetical protein
MKRIFIISLVVIGLGFVSCQKQEISPNSNDNLEVPAWSNARESDPVDTNNDDDVGGITDPNDDNDPPDEEGTTSGKTTKRKKWN